MKIFKKEIIIKIVIISVLSLFAFSFGLLDGEIKDITDKKIYAQVNGNGNNDTLTLFYATKNGNYDDIAPPPNCPTSWNEQYRGYGPHYINPWAYDWLDSSGYSGSGGGFGTGAPGNPLGGPPGGGPLTGGGPAAGAGNGCFTSNTIILMADGSFKSIEEVNQGDKVLGQTGVNTVLGKLILPFEGGDIYRFNNEDGFVTESHPFMTTDGWKSINPEATEEEGLNISVGKLQMGDQILIWSEEKAEFISKLIYSIEVDQSVRVAEVYNLMVTGDNTYIANGYLVHNKISTPCFVEGTSIFMADGSLKKIESIVVGDQVQGQEGFNNVTKTHSAVYNDYVYSINNGDAFVTEEHPFMTVDGWKAIDPDVLQNDIGQSLNKLQLGDSILVWSQNQKAFLPIVVYSIKKDTSQKIDKVYSFSTDGDHTYIADGYLVHDQENELLENQTSIFQGINNFFKNRFEEIKKADAQSSYILKDIAIGSDSVCSIDESVGVPAVQVYLNATTSGGDNLLYSTACATDDLGDEYCNRCLVCTR